MYVPLGRREKEGTRGRIPAATTAKEASAARELCYKLSRGDEMPVHFLPILTSLELDEIGGEVNFVGLAAATSETSSRDGVSGCVAVLRIFNFVHHSHLERCEFRLGGQLVAVEDDPYEAAVSCVFMVSSEDAARRDWKLGRENEDEEEEGSSRLVPLPLPRLDFAASKLKCLSLAL